MLHSMNLPSTLRCHYLSSPCPAFVQPFFCIGAFVECTLASLALLQINYAKNELYDGFSYYHRITPYTRSVFHIQKEDRIHRRQPIPTRPIAVQIRLSSMLQKPSDSTWFFIYIMPKQQFQKSANQNTRLK
jgi:hypothetical protein